MRENQIDYFFHADEQVGRLPVSCHFPVSNKDEIVTEHMGGHRLSGSTGTPIYMAPEVIKQMPYRQPSDMWSFGHMLFECCTFTSLFEASSFASLILKHDR